MKFLLIDDHDMVRDGLRAFIERYAPELSPLVAGTLDAGLALIDVEPDIGLVLLDLKLPGVEGWSGLEAVKRRRPDLPVVIISGSPGLGQAREALARGASGFIPKTLSGTALVGAIKLVHAGERYVPVSMTGIADASHPDGGSTSDTHALTGREREVLTALVAGQSNKEIARQLVLEEVTIKLHVRGLLRKLGAKNRTQVVSRALQLGLA